MTENIEYLKPIVREYRVRNTDNVLIAFLGGLLIVTLELWSIFVLNVSYEEATLMAALLALIYSAFLPFLLMPRKVREIKMTAVKTEIREIEKPVIKEKVRVVEKPVVRVRERVRVVQAPAKKRAMPKAKRYKFVGSDEAKIYHSTHSRLARLIRPKNRIYSNSEAFFVKKGFKPSVSIERDKEEVRKKAARKAARARKARAATKKKTTKKVSKKKTVKKAVKKTTKKKGKVVKKKGARK